MTYSALILDTCLDPMHSFEHIKELLDAFVNDKACVQIVVSCSSDWMMRLAQHPHHKAVYVSKLDDVYASLVHGLKAVSQDTVIVADVSYTFSQTQIDRLLQVLRTYPSAAIDARLQGYDTRLLMFCVQQAMDTHLKMDAYTDAVEQLADCPVTYVK